jgi:alanyl-tRNA synthetase
MSTTTRDIRAKFIDFFVKNDHQKITSSSLIPHNDPSLMFVNSGMVQFKNVFTGIERRDYLRAVSSQKSLRAGGKHNDLDNVGYTSRHHTFFEMLGNFSFGDYFKEQAIYYAWELLTKEFALPKEKLYVTVYHDDAEAFDYWKKIANLSDERIIKISTQDNFWSMGDTGPCGPCSEIFYDHGDKIWGGLPGSKDQDGERYVEIWNMVFMQYEQIDQQQRRVLRTKSIDTGMGLERMAAVLQGKHDNYDIDLFSDLILAIEDATKVKATSDNKFSHRIIADHLRAIAFLIADGVLPANEGRGYVLRRIMRRQMRHLHALGVKEPIIYTLLSPLIHIMGDAYPELQRASSLISEILKQEELKFKEALNKGLRVLEYDAKYLTSGGVFTGENAFKLYDTYGFPLDLTQDILRGRNITVDIVGFDKKMQEQKKRARDAWRGSGETSHQAIWFEIEAEFGATEFLGYSFDTSQSIILALVQNDKALQQFSSNAQEFWLVTNQTPFYAESGGQKGDIGYINNANFNARVIDTKKYLSIHAHLCVLEHGILKVNDNALLSIDKEYRNNLKRNHSATHLLHSALKQILGSHVTQKGSLVAFDRLRFDINHSKQISPDELELIERKVNAAIIANFSVKTFLMNKEAAVNSGAVALFGEKYDDEVRVVFMDGHHEQDKFSIELCGGTHVERTGDIGLFKIICESSVASGVRRIEAVTGMTALSFVQKNHKTLAKLSSFLQTGKDEIVDKVYSLAGQLKDSCKELLDVQIKLLEQRFEMTSMIVRAAQFNYEITHFQNIDNKSLKIATSSRSDKSDDRIIISLNSSAKDCSVIIALNNKLTDRANAGDLIRNLASKFNGSGGGNKTLAQGAFKSSIAQDLVKFLQSQSVS